MDNHYTRPSPDELKALLLRKPPAQALTLAVAESLTCGNLQSLIGSISGASSFFLGGITAYTLEQKIRHLGVPRALAEPVNCVSAEVAAAMSLGACTLFGSDFAIATTGYAEPAPDRHVGEPFAWWAIAYRNINDDAANQAPHQVTTGRINCLGLSRIAVQHRVADGALAALIAHLREHR